MKTRILKILIPILIIAFAFVQGGGWNIFHKDITVRAVGDLTIAWGVPEGNPIFVVSNMAPGDMVVKTVNVQNGASTARPVGIRGVFTSDTDNLDSVLEITISEGGVDLYGGSSGTGTKTLEQFFTESAGPDGIPLSTLGPGVNTNYDIQVKFKDSAGNEFQNHTVIFDLVIGIAIPVPEECQQIEFSGSPIFGTDGNDRINGTRGNDLIFALEGNDKVFGFGGDDCIVGGSGNDELRGETGNDILFGNEGDDLLIGAVGEDKIFGGDGKDKIRGENNDDYIEGGGGDDKITGGNGDDQILGGDGNDEISSENGTDLVLGEGGNDKINGGAGNDNLDGGTGTDNINGSAGTDTCDGEVEVNCEI